MFPPSPNEITLQDKYGPFTRTMTFIIPGPPIPKLRYRSDTNPLQWGEQKRNLQTVRSSLETQMGEKEMFHGPIFMDVTFFMQRPKSLAKKWHHSYQHQKPDIDLLILMLMNAAESVLFSGNNLVAQINSRKKYDGFPRTELTLVEIIE